MTVEFDGLFEQGEFGPRAGVEPRNWHRKAVAEREVAISRGVDGQHVFNVFAGTGAGKTDFSALVATADLNTGRARRIVVVVPSVAIADRVIEVYRERYGVHLADYNKLTPQCRKYGVTSNYQGYVVTYQGIARNPASHQKITELEKTLVIFDEVHHLGDREVWGDAAQLAFRGAPAVVTMSGSPFRPKGGFIPYARYLPTDTPGVLKYEADFAYPLGRAIVDGFCREPRFELSKDLVVEFRSGRRASFRERMSDDDAQTALSEAVRFGSPARAEFLRKSLAECRRAGRKVIIFLGGDTVTDGTPTEDAMSYLPGQLAELGYGPDEFVSVTRKGGNTAARLREFQESESAWILVTVNLVSEGVDIPELSAAIFLTTWTSDLSVVQRVGRVLRYRGKGDFNEAWVFMFGHPAYERIATDIKEEFEAEQARRRTRDRDAAEGECGDAPRGRREARVISGGDLTDVIYNGKSYPRWAWIEVDEYLAARGLSGAYRDELLEAKMKEHADVNGDADLVTV